MVRKDELLEKQVILSGVARAVSVQEAKEKGLV
jgi:hypothetical protein